MQTDFIQVKSYVGTESTGKTTLKQDLSLDITNRDVIVVEDIVDTGITLQSLKAILEKRNPKSLTFVTMLDKPSRRKVDIKADYIGKEIEDLFVIGFGLDLDEKYRNLKDICLFELGKGFYKKNDKYVEELKDAKTVIWNGPLGLSEFAQFAIGTFKCYRLFTIILILYITY